MIGKDLEHGGDRPDAGPWQLDLLDDGSGLTARPRPLAECWLVAMPEMRSVSRDLLASSRCVVIDASEGRTVLPADCLVMLWSPKDREIDCLGPAWLGRSLPSSVLDGGWLEEQGEAAPAGAIPLRRRPASHACLALEVNVRRGGAPTFPAALAPSLLRCWSSVSRLDPGVAPGADPTGAGARPELMAALHQAAAAALEDDALQGEDPGKSRVEHLRRAAAWFEAASMGSAARIAGNMLERAREDAVARRQYGLPGIDGRANWYQGPAALGATALPLFAVELPKIALSWPPELAEPKEGAAMRRVHLGKFQASVSCLAGTLSRARGAGLGVSLRIGSTEVAERPARPGDVVARFRAGATRTVSLLVDDRLNRTFGVATADGPRLAVEARCTGLRIRPEEASARVGERIRFEARGLAEGRFPLRLTLHSGGDVLTRIVRQVEILPPA